MYFNTTKTIVIYLLKRVHQLTSGCGRSVDGFVPLKHHTHHIQDVRKEKAEAAYIQQFKLMAQDDQCYAHCSCNINLSSIQGELLRLFKSLRGLTHH